MIYPPVVTRIYNLDKSRTQKAAAEDNKKVLLNVDCVL